MTRIQFPAGTGFFLIIITSRPALDLMGSRALSPAVKQPGCENDHSSPCSVKVTDQ
jgi:hypothetical protein